MKKFVSYYRVSTSRQGRSGLSLEAQREEVVRFVERTNGQLIGEFSEVESGTKLKISKRIKLQAALELAERENATLIVAKLDRLARDAEFLMKLASSSIEIYALDVPDLNTMSIGVLASVAQYESERISQRVKDSYKARRARGQTEFGATHNLTLDGAAEGRATYAEMVKNHHAGAHSLAVMLKKDGMTYREIADVLNRKGFKTLRKAAYTATHVFRMFKKYGLMLF